MNSGSTDGTLFRSGASLLQLLAPKLETAKR